MASGAHRGPSWLTALAAIAILGALACRDAGADGAAGTDLPTRDLTGAVTLRQTIGAGIEGQSDEQFGWISGAQLGPDGSIYVMDGMTRTIRRFSSDATLLNSIGRSGEGPGEFGALTAATFSGDTLLVWDNALWRVSAFLPDGTLAWTRQVQPRGSTGWMPSVAPATDGQWLYLDQEIASLSEPGLEFESGILRGTARLLAWSWAAEESRAGAGSQARGAWRMVAEFPVMEVALDTRGGSAGLSAAPFPRGPVWSPAPAGGYWYADSGRYRIVRVDIASGDTLTSIDVALEGEPVTDADWDRYVLGDESDPSSAGARARRELPRPHRKPVLGRLLSARAGDLWVRLNGSPRDSSEWHVYTADGQPRFMLRLPPRVRTQSIVGDTILAVARDSFDVQRVQVLVLSE